MSTLQELLNLGLVQIGSDDSRFAKVEAAGAALVKHLLSNPDLAIPATLIAIDCQAEEDDPFLKLVDVQLTNKWKTIRNTHINSPRELFRSITIHALSILGNSKPEMAALIWQTASSPLVHQQARLGKERELVKTLLQNLQLRSENEAIARAGFSEPPRKKRQAGKPIHFTALKDEDILHDVGRSAGPHDAASTAPEDPNPHWSNSAPHWSYEFTPRMTAALVRAVNIGMKQVLVSTKKELQTQRAELEQQLNDHLQSFHARGSRQARLDVLWWSEAKYSPSLRIGYREMQGAAAAVVMAHDLSVLVPAMAPASVTYVLGEAVTAISRDDLTREPWTVETLLDALRTSGTDLRAVIPDVTTTDGRVPLIQLVAKAIDGHPIAREEVSGTTGIDPELEISVPDFSMWVFRDIQARRLVEELR